MSCPRVKSKFTFSLGNEPFHKQAANLKLFYSHLNQLPHETGSSVKIRLNYNSTRRSKSVYSGFIPQYQIVLYE